MKRRLSEDARFELTLTAAARERRNRPMAALVIAGVIVLGAAVFAGWAIGARATARRDLARSLERQARAEVRVAEWKRLAEREGDASQSGSTEFKASRMEELAIRAGMKNRPNAPASPDDRSRPGMIGFKHIYTGVQDPSLAALVDWVRLAIEDIKGLELESIRVRPEPAGWRMDVTFRRWERTAT